MAKNVNERIKDTMAAVFNMPVKKISNASSRDNIKNWDSIKHLQLIMALEEEFNVTIESEHAAEMLNYSLIQNIINFRYILKIDF